MPDGLEVGGWDEVVDLPKLGPSLLIASCLVLAIRTARRPPLWHKGTRNAELEAEIDFAISLTSAVLGSLIAKKADIFPKKKKAWYQATDDLSPK